MAPRPVSRVCAPFVVASIVLLAGDASWADNTPAIDHERASRYMAQARALSDADGGQLWGIELYGPMLFVEPASRTVVANIPDRDGMLTASGAVYSGVLPDDVLIANTATTWAGRQWTMLRWPLPRNRYSRGKLLTHELFHRVQDEIGLPATSPENAHFDSRDGRVWLRLEWRALSEALMRDDEQRRTAIEDALAFRAHRQTLFEDRAAQERALELNEGLAEYTGFKLSGLPEAAAVHRTAMQLEDYDTRPKLVRNFAYASGPAYGLLLDAAGVQWRADLASDDDLGALLANAWQVDIQATDEAQLKRRAERYDGWQVFAEEDRRQADRDARRASYEQRFVDGPILLLAASNDINYSFNPNNVDAFADRGTVYGSVRVRDQWGELIVDRGGALMVRGDSGRVEHFIVPAPDDPEQRPLHGDGWTIVLNAGWTIDRDENADQWMLRPTATGTGGTGQ